MQPPSRRARPPADWSGWERLKGRPRSTGGPAPRWLLWTALVALLAVGQTLLVLLTLRYEDSRAMDRAEEVATTVSQEIRRIVLLRLQAVQALQWAASGDAEGLGEAHLLLRQFPEISRLERRNTQGQILQAADSPYGAALFNHVPRSELRSDGDQACAAAQRSLSPQFSRTYFIPLSAGGGLEVIEVCLAEQRAGQLEGFTVATLPLIDLLQAGAIGDGRYELSFVEADGTRLARHGPLRGAGVYVVRRALDLPGAGLAVKVDDTRGRPGLLPNLTTALVLGLSIALTAVVALLLRDMRRRTRAERALAETLAFRKAMEDSLITGLRARAMDGRITYVNPAFCSMVGQEPSALLGSGGPDGPDPPYWPPERVLEYRQRQASRELGPPPEGAPAASDRLPATLQGFETVFLRADGERFPVLIYEAPLVDGQGRQVGWMGAVLDVSERQRSEEQARVQQERLQATARLATIGEMASLLSHELNQPLAAIASYASGSLNLLRDPDEHTLSLLRDALTRMGEQAERAGRVIKSVHQFVRRREQLREPIPVSVLIEGVMPLVRMQARKSGTLVQVVQQDPRLQVMVDRTMLEQVLLNLTRNGLQAMERDTPAADRVLSITVAAIGEDRVQFEVRDRGPGIPPAVAARLFTPFFTTREDGMGLGLSLCRTVIEQHGGTLEHAQPTDLPGCSFRFTVPRAGRAAPRE